MLLTPIAGFHRLSDSIIISIISSSIPYYAIYNLKTRFGYDDRLALEFVDFHSIEIELFDSPAINGVADSFTEIQDL